jgi:hypothetical protein
MKSPYLRTTLPVLACILAAASLIERAVAFPPAPHHIIHGMVRDEMGDPLEIQGAQVYLETTNGTIITCVISPGTQPGENYRLTIPMDSLTAPDAYKPTALHATVPFRLKVKIGNTVSVPIEMTGNLAALGQPAGDTLINLTLGVDSDGDGLPDAWEYLVIAMLGGNLTLADITRNGDADGDGISNYNEYLAGTYAFDPTDGLHLSIVRRNGQGPVVQFYGVEGRDYSLQGTTNLVNWTTMNFRVPPGNTNATSLTHYLNPVSGILETEILLPTNAPTAMFYRIQVK